MDKDRSLPNFKYQIEVDQIGLADPLRFLSGTQAWQLKSWF